MHLVDLGGEVLGPGDERRVVGDPALVLEVEVVHVRAGRLAADASPAPCAAGGRARGPRRGSSRIVGTCSITPVPPGSAMSPGPSLRMTTTEAPCAAARLDCSAIGTGVGVGHQGQSAVQPAAGEVCVCRAADVDHAEARGSVDQREVGVEVGEPGPSRRTRDAACAGTGRSSRCRVPASRTRVRVCGKVPTETCAVGCR